MDEAGNSEDEAEEEGEDDNSSSDHEVLVSDQDEEDRLDELLHIDWIGYVRAKEKIAAEVDRDQALARIQAEEMQRRCKELSAEMMQHLAK